MAGLYSTQRTYKNEYFLIIYLDKWDGMAEDQWLGRSAIEAVPKLNNYSYNFYICTSLFPTTHVLFIYIFCGYGYLLLFFNFYASFISV